MKISYDWLKKYFDKPLPKAEKVAELLTMHAFEVESVEKRGSDSILDVKIMPNRAHDCLCHRGIARQISTLLEMPMSHDALTQIAPELERTSNKINVSIDSPLCRRYMAAVITGIKVGPSPDWLRSALESVGQRSINNIVDATNYVMFDLGQPIHAFDASKIKGGIIIRHFERGENLDLLRTTREIKGGITADWARRLEQLENQGALVIADENGPIALAGIKGGEEMAVREKTTSIILEVANFNPIAVRRASNIFGLRTDASVRFEHGLSTELPAYAMASAVELILKMAGGKVEACIDRRTTEIQKPTSISFSKDNLNKLLGTELSETEIENTLKRLNFSSIRPKSGEFIVEPPFERLDLRRKEDIIEEIAQVLGYEHLKARPTQSAAQPLRNKHFYYADKIRFLLSVVGFSEVYTYAFRDDGAVELENPLASDKKYLRHSLAPALHEALQKNLKNAPLLGLEAVRIFEIGTIFPSIEDEEIYLGIAAKSVGKKPTSKSMLEAAAKALEEGLGLTIETEFVDDVYLIDFEDLIERLPMPTIDDKWLSFNPPTNLKFKPISQYPFALRDVAVWTPKNIEREKIETIIKNSAGLPAQAGDLLVRLDCFDTFAKEGRVSHAFHLVFQSQEKTLSDSEIDAMMKKIEAALRLQSGFEVR